MRTTAEVRAEIEEQRALEPGTPGWWQVWGATVRDVSPGDFVVTRTDDFFVQDVYDARSAARLGVVVDGQRETIGRMCPVAVLRRGTRATLSEHAR